MLKISKKELFNAILDLYKAASFSIPDDIYIGLKNSLKNENAVAKLSLKKIIENCDIAFKKNIPLCQDTGTPIFYIYFPKTISQSFLENIIISATKKAKFLRANTIDPLTEKKFNFNIPIMHFFQWNNSFLKIDLLLKGAGSENVSIQYSLPNKSLNATRNISGIKKCVLDAVFKAQGFGCPPGILGVCIGGNKVSSMIEAERQLFRRIDDSNKNIKIRRLEKELLKDINLLNIGPLGFGGNTTALAVKLSILPRHPASFFVSISYCCWACRRGTLEFKEVVKID